MSPLDTGAWLVRATGMIPFLQPTDPFPPLERALRRPNGLLAAGRDLSVGTLAEAYGQGIFPWFSDGEPILWWSPDPRMVLSSRPSCTYRSPSPDV